jgi:hypothetical protein
VSRKPYPGSLLGVYKTAVFLFDSALFGPFLFGLSAPLSSGFQAPAQGSVSGLVLSLSRLLKSAILFSHRKDPSRSDCSPHSIWKAAFHRAAVFCGVGHPERRHLACGAGKYKTGYGRFWGCSSLSATSVYIPPYHPLRNHRSHHCR